MCRTILAGRKQAGGIAEQFGIYAGNVLSHVPLQIHNGHIKDTCVHNTILVKVQQHVFLKYLETLHTLCTHLSAATLQKHYRHL